MMGNLRRSTVVALLGAFGASTACSAADEPQKKSLESAASVPPDGLRGKTVSVTTAGELCPQGNGDIYISDAGDLIDWTAPPDADARPPQSTKPSCSITLEADVPAGFQMGVPSAVWRGYSIGVPGTTGNAIRTYSFENGDSSTTTPASNLADEFDIVDRGAPSTNHVAMPAAKMGWFASTTYVLSHELGAHGCADRCNATERIPVMRTTSRRRSTDRTRGPRCPRAAGVAPQRHR